MGLSDIKLRKTPPKKTRFELSDGEGLSLLVLPSGTKSWIFRYQFKGRPRRISLGIYPSMSLSDARAEAENTRNMIRQNADPAVKKAEALAAHKTAPTIKDIVAELWERELKKKKSGKDTLRLLEKDVVKAWGRREVKSITRRHIVLLLDEIEQRAPIVRNRVHGALTRLFNFAAERGIIDDSPCTRIKKVTENPRKRVLSDEEIHLLWEATAPEQVKLMDCYRLSKLALRLVLVTGQRPGEVAGMAWDEIDGTTWNIPLSRMKNGDPHNVHLTDMALEIIEEARAYSDGSAHVFKSTHRAGDAPMTAHALSRAIRNHWRAIGIKEPFTPHDLRRTLRTRLAALGVDDVVAEKVIGHKLQGIAAVYNQHPYTNERRAALEKWENHLRGLVGLPVRLAEVVQLHAAGG